MLWKAPRINRCSLGVPLGRHCRSVLRTAIRAAIGVLVAPLALKAQCLDINQALKDLKDKTYRSIVIQDQRTFEQFFWSDDFEKTMRRASGGATLKIPLVGEVLPIAFDASSENAYEKRRTITDHTQWKTDQAQWFTATGETVSPNAAEVLRAVAVICMGGPYGASKPNQQGIWTVQVGPSTQSDVQVIFSYTLQKPDKKFMAHYKALTCSSGLNCTSQAAKFKKNEPLDPGGTPISVAWNVGANTSSIGTITLQTDLGTPTTPQITRKPRLAKVEYDVPDGHDIEVPTNEPIVFTDPHPNMHEIGCDRPNTQVLSPFLGHLYSAGFETWCTDKWVAARKRYDLVAGANRRFSTVDFQCSGLCASHWSRVGPTISADRTHVTGWTQNWAGPVTFVVIASQVQVTRATVRESKDVDFNGSVAKFTIPSTSAEAVLAVPYADGLKSIRLAHADKAEDWITCKADNKMQTIDFTCTLRETANFLRVMPSR